MDFLSDPEVLFLGHQVNPAPELEDFFLFAHRGCRSILSLSLDALAGLAPLPVLNDSCHSQGIPMEFCLARQTNKACPPKCVCEFVACTARLIESWKGTAQN